MHVERRLLQWGAFFIVFGAVPLAVQLGWLDRSAFNGAGRLWPILIIVIGLGILLARSRFELLGGLLFTVTLGLILGAVLAGGIGSIGCIGSGQATSVGPVSGGTFGTAAQVDLTIDCGSATMTTIAGSAWSFSSSSDPDRRPVVTASTDSLQISNNRSGLLNLNLDHSSWQLLLPAAPSLDLALEMNAGDAHLDLAGAHLDGLSMTANAGTARVNLAGAASVGSIDATVNAGDVLVALPSAPMHGSITVNAGHLGLCLAAGTSLRIDSGGALSGNNYASQGLVQDGSTWTTPGLGEGVPTVDLSVTANAGNVELNPQGGCQ